MSKQMAMRSANQQIAWHHIPEESTCKCRALMLHQPSYFVCLK